MEKSNNPIEKKAKGSSQKGNTNECSLFKMMFKVTNDNRNEN